MKYKKIRKIKGGYYKVVDQYLFVLENDNSPFYIYDLNELKLIRTVGDGYGGGIYLLNNCVVDESHGGVETDKLIKIQLFPEKKFYYSNQNDKYVIIREFVAKFKIQYKLLYRKSLVERQILDVQGSIELFENSGLIISWTGVSSLFAYLYDTELLFQWRFDLSLHYLNVKDARINAIKIYQDSLLVITNAGVLRLCASDGSVIWKTDGYARTLEIVGNIGYVCTGGSLFTINLDTGEESGYGWDCDGLPYFTYKGVAFRASGHEVVYHDGLLWYSVYSSGHSFLIAINPENGHYEWIHHVDTNEKTRAPQFYGDKMFLSDSGGLLHIYEKE